ncbi:phage virion morphogenesis protein [Sphingobium aromaticiconvertens]|uniref:phage virion morphogenesis protein n=1 Tax=Sphingobium aromaticiconvertens TaxID=365341 RepID=UPI003015A7F8
MSGIDVTIELNDQALDRALAKAIKNGVDMRQPMAEIADEWMVAVRDRFAQERDPLGIPWMKRRDNSDPGRPLLQQDRFLFNAVEPRHGSDFAQVGVLRTAGPARYARIHNEGGTIKPKNGKALSFGGRIVAQVTMPKRQFLGFGEVERQSTVEILSDFMRGLFNEGAA